MTYTNGAYTAFTYDNLGRLIGTSQTGGAGELRATYRYDTNNRLTLTAGVSSWLLPKKVAAVL